VDNLDAFTKHSFSVSIGKNMALLLAVNDIQKSYGERPILMGATFTVSERQKIGVIGRNGAGKSTLFRIILGEEECDSGTVQLHNGARLGHIAQHDDMDLSETALSYLVRTSEKESWQAAKLAHKFELNETHLDSQLQNLSGGYRMRVKLVAMLLQDPNVLLLDEPTNFLDLSTILLLGDFLKQYSGSFLLISHDRAFLRDVCTETLDIERGRAYSYPGQIDAYLEYREAQLEMQKKYNKKIEKERAHVQEFIDRFRAKASKATQAQSKMKYLEKLKTIEIEAPLHTTRIRIPNCENKKGIVLRTEELSMGYTAESPIADGITFEVHRGEHVAIVGDNGQGKTTLLRTLAKDLLPLSGTATWHPTVSIGYYAQHMTEQLNPFDTVLGYLERAGSIHRTTQEVLEIAGNFLFRAGDIEKPLSVLSGGERARLCLAGLMLGHDQVLLLDEPTNHLDFETVESLAQALHETNRTILLISHNRAFVEQIATGIIEVNNGQVKRYHHSYTDYVYHLGDIIGRNRRPTVVGKPIPTLASDDERPRLKEEIKEQKKLLRDIEEEVADLEKEQHSIHKWFLKHPGEYSIEKTKQLQTVELFLKEKESQWFGVQEKLSELEAKYGRI
jgi:ATP-binding cassette, subfamily F, member 3